MRALLIILAALVGMLVFCALVLRVADPKTIVADDGKQADRLAFIEDLKEAGAIVCTQHVGRLSPAITVWVTDDFLAADTRTQNKLLSPIWSYYAIMDDRWGDPRLDHLIVKWDDGTVNGRRIGIYDPFNGLR